VDQEQPLQLLVGVQVVTVQVVEVQVVEEGHALEEVEEQVVHGVLLVVGEGVVVGEEEEEVVVVAF